MLIRELARPSWRGDQVAIGTATDAYQPCEGRYQLTRRCLEALLAARNPVGIVTKSTLILRDLDLLTELARVARVRVYLTITTLDETLWRSLEPGTPPPAQRLRALQRLNAAGVPAGVLMAPVLPGLTDSSDAMRALAAAARANGAVALHHAALRLAPLVKEHYFGWVGQRDTELLARYARAYPGGAVNPPANLQAAIDARFAAVKAEFGFTEEPRRVPPRDPAVTRILQLSLFPAPAADRRLA